MKITSNQVKVGHGLPAAQAGVPESRIIVADPPLPRVSQIFHTLVLLLGTSICGFLRCIESAAR